jgi:TPR repeat protein
VLAVVSAGACASDADRCIKGDDVALCERACAGGDANACLKLGAMHAARSEQSLSAFRRACALGMQEGCERLKLVVGSGGLANCDKIADKIVARLNAYLPGDPEARKQAEARRATRPSAPARSSAASTRSTARPSRTASRRRAG